MNPSRRCVVSLAVALAAPLAHAQPWIERLERHPSPLATLRFVDVTNEGVALGQYSFAFQTTLVDTGFFWSKTSSLQLIASPARWTAAALSDDGSTAFGVSIGSGTIISYKAGAAGTSSSSIVGRVVGSAIDGSEAFGSLSTDPRTGLLFSRTSPASSLSLPAATLSGSETRDTEALGAVGTRIFGNASFRRISDGATILRAVSWNRAGSPITASLLALPFGNTSCVLNSISVDGAWGAGAAVNASGVRQPWLYVSNVNAWAPLPLVVDDASGEALDLSANGATVIGNSRSPGSSADRGRVWCNTLRFSGRSVESLLASRGLDLSHWTGLSVRKISPDGRYLIGDGFYDSVENSWIAFVGNTCCTADIDDNGVVDLSDFFAFFGCWDLSGPCADLDANPGTDLNDFFAFFNAFDAGC